MFKQVINKIKNSFRKGFLSVTLRLGNIELEFHLFVVLLSLFFGCVYYYYNNLWCNSVFYVFWGYVVPVLFVMHIIITIVLLVFRPKSSLVLLIPFLMSFEIASWIFAFNVPPKVQKTDIHIMNYNVGTFDLYRFFKKSNEIEDTTFEVPQVRFLISSKADVLCLQEFYNNDMKHSEAVINKLASAGYTYYYTNPMTIDYSRGFYGVITFSKFPICKFGSIDFNYSKDESRIFNRGIYSDIVIGSDTVRVINIHLHSMDLRLEVLNGINDIQGLSKSFEEIYHKMRIGSEKRGDQIGVLQLLIESSPYPVVLCGDFNDLPSSFTYRFIKKRLKNSHESAGFGFGFTYNKKPWFIRIDHQFFDSRLKINYSRVITENRLSDHYPLMAGYEFSH